MICDKGFVCSYDKLLIATGAESFIPPVGALRTAPNVFGLRHLSDAKAIDKCAENAQKVVIIGSGLVGLDAAYGLLEQKKDIVIVEMADRILPIQLDETGAAQYQKLLNRQAVSSALAEEAQILSAMMPVKLLMWFWMMERSFPVIW